MIPYFQYLTIHLGPIPIQVWGLLVSLGILAGAWTAARMAKHRGQDPQLVWDLSAVVIVGAFIVARGFMVFYYPSVYLADPVELLRIWHGGFSIMGGFVGALIAGIWYLRRHHVDVYAYADTAIFGLPLGLAIGRIGCFLIHDHPGTLSDFALAVKFPGGARHDLGLYESINGAILFLVFLWLARRGVKTGMYAVVFLIWYGATRFFLDFLRATDGAIVDARYFSLTPAQYLAIVMVAGGVWLATKRGWTARLPTNL